MSFDDKDTTFFLITIKYRIFFYKTTNSSLMGEELSGVVMMNMVYSVLFSANFPLAITPLPASVPRV
jgi:hypothetical protein